MNLQQDIISKTEKHVRDLLYGEGTGHDWWHIERVRNMALHIGQKEQADLFIIELAALLHDIADHKFHGGDIAIGPKVADHWMEGVGVDKERRTHVCQIIKDLSFKGAEVQTPMHSIEGMVVQDADRLDAIGAIGIARAFAYGGYKQRELYNPDVKPVLHTSFEAYTTNSAPSLNHFYEKLLLLKDRMNTSIGKTIALERHTFMEQYIRRFLSEWDGKE